MTPTRALSGACVVLLVALAVGACSDSEPSEPTTSQVSTSPSPSGSTSPSQPAEPSVSPASGPVLDVGSATINLPDGWKKVATGLPNTYSGTANRGADLRLITVLDLPSTADYTLDERAQDAMSGLPGADLTRRPDVELDGSTAYHVAGTAPVRGDYEVVGTGDRGRGISISFSLNGYTAAERRELVDSVIASFRWKA